jgi:hypothetical protein
MGKPGPDFSRHFGRDTDPERSHSSAHGKPWGEWDIAFRHRNGVRPVVVIPRR